MREVSFKYTVITVFLFLVNIESVKSQFNTVGFPFHKNYTKSEYQAGLQSWMISQSSDGIMYFANNEGLLEFDGLFWNLYPVPGRTIVRSVYACDNGNIYVGSSNNLGWFKNDKDGHLKFFSLKKLLPADKQDFGEVWKIYKTKDGIIFQSFKQLMIYKNNKIDVISAKNLFHFSFYVNNKLYVIDNSEGLYLLKNNKLILLKGTNPLSNNEVCSVLPYGNDILISTINNGAYIYNGKELKAWNTKVSDFLKKNQIYCALRINQEYIAFGTIQNGLIISKNDGTPVLTVNETKGLQNNTILCMGKDKENNLWLGTDNGIDLLYINRPFTMLNRGQNLSAGYSAALHNGILYLGTNRGVFYKNWNECLTFPTRFSDFKLIESTKGQVWSLKVIDDKLFCGHNKGVYIITETDAKKISDIPGAWTFLRSENHSDKIICGTYNGLILFKKNKGTWIFSKKLSGFEESSRLMEVDKDETIWMSHGFKGVYHIRMNSTFDSISSVDFYNSENGFNTNYGINVTKLKGQILFLSPEGIFEFNDSINGMQLSKKFNDFFSDEKVNYAIESEKGDIWYFYENSVAVKRIQEDGNYTEIKLPFKPLEGKFIGGFQFVYPINKSHILFGYENGFINYNPNQIKNYKNPFPVFMNRVVLSGKDSILFNGHLFKNNENIPVLKYKENNIHFLFSAVNFDNPEKNQFSTFLKGFDSKWSDWGTRSDREFTNLKEGDYAFYVKAKNIYGVESKPVIYYFKINPPWSRTNIAYGIYIILIILLAILTVKYIKYRHRKIKYRELAGQKEKYIKREEELQKEKLIAEKEVFKLRNDKLRQEMKTKNKELADSTMQTIQKNKFLKSLKVDLNTIYINTYENSNKNNIKKLIKKINFDINNEDNWKVFEKYFSNVHEEFLNRLKTEFSEISPAELRLCACLRMNISSKEIADLLNISVRGVEASRYRLRKTLKLDRKTNLTDFILSY